VVLFSETANTGFWQRTIFLPAVTPAFVNLRQRSTAVVQGFCKAKVGSSILSAGANYGEAEQVRRAHREKLEAGSGKTGTRQVAAGVFAEAPKQAGKVEQGSAFQTGGEPAGNAQVIAIFAGSNPVFSTNFACPRGSV
jgi:hypothetical protein